MDFFKIGKRFYKKYKTEDGLYFKALIGKPSMTGRYTNYVVGGMVLFTDIDCPIDVGTIFYSQSGRVMMIMDNAEEESCGPTQKSFVVRILTKKFTWKRQKDIINPITKMKETTKIENLGSFWCSLESSGNRTDNMHITVGKYTFVCNKDLKEGDIIDDKYRITKSENLVGVTVAYGSKC
jgi:hypothetical protein